VEELRKKNEMDTRAGCLAQLQRLATEFQDCVTRMQRLEEAEEARGSATFAEDEMDGQVMREVESVHIRPHLWEQIYSLSHEYLVGRPITDAEAVSLLRVDPATRVSHITHAWAVMEKHKMNHPLRIQRGSYEGTMSWLYEQARDHIHPAMKRHIYQLIAGLTTIHTRTTAAHNWELQLLCFDAMMTWDRILAGDRIASFHFALFKHLKHLGLLP
jgi:hypothetical protein